MCNHPQNQHCHKCEKAKHWDIFFMVWAVSLTIFILGVSDGEAGKYVIGPWLFLALLYVAKYFMDKSKKKK